MATMTEFPLCSQPATEWDSYNMTPEEEDAETQRGLRSLMERRKPCRGCWSHYRENTAGRIVCDCTEAEESEELQEVEVPAVLRIRIPPFEEIEEELVIPHWPDYPADATGAQKIAVDRGHVASLIALVEQRSCQDEKAELTCELFVYLRHRPILLQTSVGFRQQAAAKADQLHRELCDGTMQTFWKFDLMTASKRLWRLIQSINQKKTA